MEASKLVDYDGKERKIRQIIKELTLLKDNESVLESDSEIYFEVKKILEEYEADDIDLEKGDLSSIIEFLSSLDSGNSDSENTSSVPVSIVRKLLEEYNQKIEKGIADKQARAEITNKYKNVLQKKQIDDFLSRQNEIYQQSLKKINEKYSKEKGASFQDTAAMKETQPEEIVFLEQRKEIIKEGIVQELNRNQQFKNLNIPETVITNSIENSSNKIISGLTEKDLKDTAGNKSQFAKTVANRLDVEITKSIRNSWKLDEGTEINNIITNACEEVIESEYVEKLQIVEIAATGQLVGEKVIQRISRDNNEINEESKLNEKLFFDLADRNVNFGRETEVKIIPEIGEKDKINSEINNQVEFSQTQIDIKKLTCKTTRNFFSLVSEDNSSNNLIQKNKEEIVREAEQIIEDVITQNTINDNFETAETKLTNVINSVKQSDDQKIEADQTNTGTISREIVLSVENTVETNQEKIKRYQERLWDQNTDWEFIKENPDKKLDWQKIDLYKQQVKQIYFKENPIDKFKKESVDFAVQKGNGIGKTENGWTELRGLTTILKMKPGEFKLLLKQYKNARTLLEGTKLPYTVSEIRAFEGLMQLVSESESLKNLVFLSQNVISFYDKVNYLSGGAFKKIGWEKAGKTAFTKIGGQAINEFARESLTIISEQGLKQGLWQILKGILGGGVKAAAAGGAEAGAVGGGTAAAVAAWQAIPVVGQIVLVLAITVVAAKIVYKTIIKPIINAAKNVFGYLGITSESISIGIKKTLQDTFGKLGGGIINFIVKLGMLAGGVAALISSALVATFVAPVIFGVVGLTFVLQFLNSNLMSGLVPPVGIGSAEMVDSGSVLSEPTGPVPEDCPSGWPSTKGCITQGPNSCGTHCGDSAIDIGCVSIEDNVYATHRGLAVPVEYSDCGHAVEIWSTCNGKKFFTRYCHLLYVGLDGPTEVQRGQSLGAVDSSGYKTTGNHIHYSLNNLGGINDYLPRIVPEGCLDFNNCGNITINP